MRVYFPRLLCIGWPPLCTRHACAFPTPPLCLGTSLRLRHPKECLLFLFSMMLCSMTTIQPQPIRFPL